MSCNFQDAPDAKKPRSILKQSSSFDKHSISSGFSNHRKSAKFDELNVLQTYHPPDKDYGHMKIEEPKTPYNYTEAGEVDQLDAELLVERLNVAANARLSISSEESSEEGEEETDDQKDKRVEFEKRRKLHYNEFEAVKLARKLIEEEDDDGEDEQFETNENVDNLMEVEERDSEQSTSTCSFGK